MRELSLFTGAGGGLLGTKLLGWHTVGYVEFNKYCQQIIAQRIKDGILDEAPIFSDIRTFNDQQFARSYQGMVDIITAGFPCQPFSVAGKQLGADDPRNMWPATIACIRTIRPQLCWLENVPALAISEYFGTILGELAEAGYDIRWRILSAAELGAPHKRNRLWILAYTKHGSDVTNERQTGEKKSLSQIDRKKGYPRVSTGTSIDHKISSEKLGNTQNKRLQGFRTSGEQIIQSHDGQRLSMCSSGGWWEYDPAEAEAKSRVGRVADGVASRMDRLKALGNGQVPAVVQAAYKLLAN